MALTKNKISVPFVTGLETKSDENQDQLEGLRVLENVIFDNPKKFRKRLGYNSIDTKLTDNSEIQNSKFLANFEEELGLFTDTNFYSFAESIERFSDKGRVFTAFPESRTVVRNDKEQKNIDCVSIENINVFSYEDSTGIRYSVIDNQNNNVIISNVLISASGVRPRVSNIQNTVYIFYIDGTDIKFVSFNILTPASVSSETVFTSDLDAANTYDVESIADKIFVAYESTLGGGSIRSASIDSGNVISSFINIVGESASDSISVATDSSSRVIISYSNGTDVKFTIFSFTLGVNILAPTVIETISGARNVVALEESTSMNYRVFYEITAASVKDYLVKQNTVDINGTVGTASIVKRSVGIASKPFLIDSLSYIALIHESTLQSTYFLADQNSTIVTKFSPSLGGELLADNVVSKVNSLGDSKYLVGTQIKGRLVEDTNTFFSLLGVNSTVLDFELDDPFQNEKLGGNLHIAGGIPMMYDGNVVVEHGFHLFPEDLSAGSSMTTGGSMGDGIYQYAAVYAWTDNKGQIHRSAPSIGLEVTLSGATNTQQQDIDVPTLRLSQKENVIVELYRTEAAGTIFYKITSVTNPIVNDDTVDTVTITDTSSDTDLISNELLYTTGGVLDNIAAPSSSIIESFSDRIFLAGLEDPNRLQFSKLRFADAPVEFNDVLTIQVNSKGGDITSLKTMDEKIIIFKESAIFYLSGDGPNNLGEQDTFTKPELISSDIGCINVNSVVLTPLGLMFKSQKGIYLLGRNLSLQYIGDNVEEFNDLQITSAIVVGEENQVRFTTKTGDALVYNYYVNQWASFSNHKALSAVNINFDYFYLRSDGVLYKQDNVSYNDNGTPINMKLETGWISFAGVQAFQRVYKLLILGEFKSPHKIRVRIAYDFVDAFTQEVIVDTNDFTDYSKYGDDSPYGAGSPYGGDGNVHQFRVDLKRQKCQAIKIRIEEIQSDLTNIGEGLSISNIMLEVGQKMGVNKIATGRKYGTS